MSASNYLDVLKGTVPERPPIFFFDFTMGVGVAGYETSDLFIPHYDGEKIGRCVLASRKMLGHDSAIGCPFVFDQRTLGGEVRYKGKSPPMTTRCAFKNADHLYECDINTMASICPEQKKSFEYVRRNDPDFCVGVSIPSPMSLGCQLRGYENFVMESMTEQEYIHDLTDICREYSKMVSGNIIESNLAHYLMITSAFDIPEVFGPEFYKNSVIPTYREEVGYAEKGGIPCVIHPHGCLTDTEGKKNLSKIIDTGIDSIYFGENNDMHTLAEQCNGKVSLIGGVDSFTTIFLGDEERIDKDVKTCVEPFKGTPFIMSCSCSVESFLPIEKMKMMVNSTRRCRLK